MDVIGWQSYLLGLNSLNDVRVEGDDEGRVERIYALVRAKLVQKLPNAERERTLVAVYGSPWSQPIWPNASRHDSISSIKLSKVKLVFHLSSLYEFSSSLVYRLDVFLVGEFEEFSFVSFDVVVGGCWGGWRGEHALEEFTAATGMQVGHR